jgi:hypothetical protein
MLGIRYKEALSQAAGMGCSKKKTNQKNKMKSDLNNFAPVYAVVGVQIQKKMRV